MIMVAYLSTRISTFSTYPAFSMCPDNITACPAGAGGLDACCPRKDGGYGCCPSEGVCCADQMTCCNLGYHCNAQAGHCDANNKTAHPLIPFTPLIDLCNLPANNNTLQQIPHITDDGRSFRYYASPKPLVVVCPANTGIKIAVVAIHGTAEAGGEYLCAVTSAANMQVNFKPSELAVFEMRFLMANIGDPRMDPVPTDEIFWNNTLPDGDWRAGSQTHPDGQPIPQPVDDDDDETTAQTDAPSTISSFDILDHFVSELLTNTKAYPNLQRQTEFLFFYS